MSIFQNLISYVLLTEVHIYRRIQSEDLKIDLDMLAEVGSALFEK